MTLGDSLSSSNKNQITWRNLICKCGSKQPKMFGQRSSFFRKMYCQEFILLKPFYYMGLFCGAWNVIYYISIHYAKPNTRMEV